MRRRSAPTDATTPTAGNASMPSTLQRQAFSMVELLVVIAIMGVLAAMILTGAQALGIGSKKARTQTILAAVRKGLELTIANKGSSFSPVEHPFAGSRAPRFQFTRSKINGPGAVATSGDALKGVALINLGGIGSAPTLLLDDDVFIDKQSYLLYGMTRDRLNVLGAIQKRVSKWVMLPKPAPGAASPVVVQTNGAFNAANYPQWTFPTAANDNDNGAPGPTTPGYGFGKPGANKQLLDYVFGSSNVQSELAGLKALYMADPNTADNIANPNGPANAFHFPVNQAVTPTAPGAPGSDPEQLALVYTDGKKESFWKPGCISTTGTSSPYTMNIGSASSNWYHYRLPGLALYDAWGIEVLYSISTLGGVRLQSAGADGVFKYDPGDNHILETTINTADPTTTSLDPKDKDGSRDNISQEVEDQQ